MQVPTLPPISEKYLTRFSTEIKTAIDQGDNLAGDAMAQYWIAGHMLNEVKDYLEHGRFGTWLAAEGINDRKAQRYMQLNRDMSVTEAREFPSLRQALGVSDEPKAPRELEIKRTDADIEAELEALRRENKELREREKARLDAFQDRIDAVADDFGAQPHLPPTANESLEADLAVISRYDAHEHTASDQVTMSEDGPGRPDFTGDPETTDALSPKEQLASGEMGIDEGPEFLYLTNGTAINLTSYSQYIRGKLALKQLNMAGNSLVTVKSNLTPADFDRLLVACDIHTDAEAERIMAFAPTQPLVGAATPAQPNPEPATGEIVDRHIEIKNLEDLSVQLREAIKHLDYMDARIQSIRAARQAPDLVAPGVQAEVVRELAEAVHDRNNRLRNFANKCDVVMTLYQAPDFVKDFVEAVTEGRV